MLVALVPMRQAIYNSAKSAGKKHEQMQDIYRNSEYVVDIIHSSDSTKYIIIIYQFAALSYSILVCLKKPRLGKLGPSAQNMWSARSTPCSGRGDLFIELIALISYRFLYICTCYVRSGIPFACHGYFN